MHVMNYTRLCGKICQWLATGRWVSTGIPVFSTNKTDRHDIAEIVLKVESYIITLIPNPCISTTNLLDVDPV